MADMNWKTIDSAPKDGRDILVYDRQRYITIVQWDEYYSKWVVSDYDAFTACDATHWMPLPEPPIE